MAEFGRIVTSHDVERAVLNTCRAWIDTYLSEIERSRDDLFTRQIGRPRSYTTTAELVDLHERGQLPAVVCECAAMAARPTVTGGLLDGAWQVTVIVIVKSGQRGETRQRVSLYEAAVRTLLVQHPALGGFADSLLLGASRYDAVAALRDQTLAGCEIPVTVAVSEINSRYGGPETPDDPAPTDPPEQSPTDPVHSITNVTVEALQ